MRQDLKVCCSTMEMALQSCGCQTTMPAAAPCAPSCLLKNLQQSHKEPRIRKMGKIQIPLNQTKDYISFHKLTMTHQCRHLYLLHQNLEVKWAY
jgi:hypothetical protein